VRSTRAPNAWRVRDEDFSPPTNWQLRRHAVNAAIPMVGFGFMDNVIMIQAGDYIDSTLGVTLGLSTLTAAAFGQVVSDVSGTLFGNTIDHIAARSGLPTAKLTDSQRRMRRVRLAGMAGAVGGVIVGCLLGMTTLLFKDLGKNERLRRQREMSTLFSTLMQEGHELIGAEHCTLQLVDTDGEHLFSHGMRGKPPTEEEMWGAFRAYDSGSSGSVDAMELSAALRALGWSTNPSQAEKMIASVDVEGDGQLTFAQFSSLLRSAILSDEVRITVRVGGTRHHVLTRGEMLNVVDVRRHPLCSYEVYRLRGYEMRSLLIGPVFGDDGAVVGLVELVNKTGADGQPDPSGFHRDDERMLQMLCSHCSIFLKNLSGD